MSRSRRGTCWLWDPIGTIAVPDGIEELRWSPLVGCADWDRAIATAHALAGADVLQGVSVTDPRELSGILSTADSLVVMACLQDLSQARSRWDRAADGFLTLFTHTLVLPGIADMTTLRQISDLAGQVDVPTSSTSRTNQLVSPTTTSWHTERRPRLPVDVIAAGRPGEALLLSRAHPARVRL